MLTGYANKIARRIQRHNGYKTLGPRGVLAQLHPSTSTLALDEDGMLPQWVAFHELLQTARTFISKVLFFSPSALKNHSIIPAILAAGSCCTA